MAKPRRPRDRGARAQSRPPNLVTSKDAEELARSRATIANARRLLIADDHSGALAVLSGTEPSSKKGRKGRSGQEIKQLAGMYENMMSAPCLGHRKASGEMLDGQIVLFSEFCGNP